MRRRFVGPVVAMAVAISTPLLAAEPRVNFRIPAGSLAQALRAFSQQAGGVNLLFDPARVQGVRTAGLFARVEPNEGLDQLLTGSGLGYRRLPNGDYTIVSADSQATKTTPLRSASEEVTNLPELLVVGRRSLNTDLPRSADDIQPYQVTTSHQIALAQSTSLEDFLRSRSPSNTEQTAQNQAPVQNRGGNGSSINLGGFGTGQTLVLVDGRRLAAIPVFGDFLQADLNGISPASIDRVETLTATAGGIYGPGAVGGVVNVVLNRNFDGVEVGATTGVSDRGDGRRWRLDGSAGRTFNAGATRIMVAVSHAADDGLRVGQRDYIYRSRMNRSRNGSAPNPFTSPSINVLAYGSLTIAGGPALSSTMTYIPTVAGLASGGVDALVANAGSFDMHLSSDGAGTLQSSVASTSVNSAVVSVRQRIGPRVELFSDVLFLDNKGMAATPWLTTDSVGLQPGKNGNPFTSPVQVTFPTPGMSGTASTEIQTGRATLGVIARLPAGWSTDIDLSLARTRVESATYDAGYNADFVRQTGVNLFAGASALQAALASYAYRETSRSVHVNTMTDANLRLAGPLFRTDAGVTTLTLLAETRREHSPAAKLDAAAALRSAYVPGVGQTQTVGSGYAELRAPLIATDSDLTLLRGLELQLAGRYDGFQIKVPAIKVNFGGLDGVTAIRARLNVSTLTAGFKVAPITGVLLRTSYSTGYLPPSPSQLIPSYRPLSQLNLADYDPKRLGDLVLPAAGALARTGGSPTLKPEKARTFSIGTVLTPSWLRGARVSVDYTRIDKSGEIAVPTSSSFSQIFKLEDRYPGIVQRAPLTPGDAAKGYTAGQILFFDASLRNLGRSSTQIIEVHGDYALQTKIGLFGVYGHAVSQPFLTKSTTPLVSNAQYSGQLDGPLKLRGNTGVTWTKSGWDAGLNLQFYSRYAVTYGGSDALSVELSRGPFATVQYQGADTVPAQAYVDATVGYTFNRQIAPVRVRMGMRNLFGSSPPAVAIPLEPSVYGFATEQGLGYSPYGDARGRRFEVSVARRF